MSVPQTSQWCSSTSTPTLCVYSAEMQGKRGNMEDEVVVSLAPPSTAADALSLQSTGRVLSSVVGLFDGHGGGHTSKFLAKTLPAHIRALTNSHDDEQLKECAVKLDRFYMESELPEGLNHDLVGSTALWAVIDEIPPPPLKGSTAQKEVHPLFMGRDAFTHRVSVCNVGDCRAILVKAATFRGGALVTSVTAVTQDHKPNDLVERARVERAGGYVGGNGNGIFRVNGSLSVSRAFGDLHLKSHLFLDNPKDRLPAAECHVSCVPDVFHLEMRPGDTLILACDGVWDQLSTEQVGKFVRRAINHVAKLQLGGGESPAVLGQKRARHHDVDADGAAVSKTQTSPGRACRLTPLASVEEKQENAGGCIDGGDDDDFNLSSSDEEEDAFPMWTPQNKTKLQAAARRRHERAVALVLRRYVFQEQDIASALLYLAQHSGTGDNTSAIVMRARSPASSPSAIVAEKEKEEVVTEDDNGKTPAASSVYSKESFYFREAVEPWKKLAKVDDRIVDDYDRSNNEWQARYHERLAKIFRDRHDF